VTERHKFGPSTKEGYVCSVYLYRWRLCGDTRLDSVLFVSSKHRRIGMTDESLIHAVLYVVMAFEVTAIAVLVHRILKLRRWLKINGRITDAVWPPKDRQS
jgi:hypothetical protein